MTKSFVPVMHRVFQHDLYRLRLSTARAYVHALETSSNPLTLSQLEPLKLSAQVRSILQFSLLSSNKQGCDLKEEPYEILLKK